MSTLLQRQEARTVEAAYFIEPLAQLSTRFAESVLEDMVRRGNLPLGRGESALIDIAARFHAGPFAKITTIHAERIKAESELKRLQKLWG